MFLSRIAVGVGVLVALHGVAFAQSPAPAAPETGGISEAIAIARSSAEEARAANDRIQKRLDEMSAQLTKLDKSIWNEIGTGFIQDQFNAVARYMLGQNTQSPPPVFLVTLGSFLLLTLKGAQGLASISKKTTWLEKGLNWLVPKAIWAYLGVLAAGFVLLAVQFGASGPEVVADNSRLTQLLENNRQQLRADLKGMQTVLEEIKQGLGKAGAPPTAVADQAWVAMPSRIDALNTRVEQLSQSQPGLMWKALVAICAFVAAAAAVMLLARVLSDP